MLIAMPRSKSYCPYCARTKALFAKLDVPHKVIELDELGGESQGPLACILSEFDLLVSQLQGVLLLTPCSPSWNLIMTYW